MKKKVIGLIDGQSGNIGSINKAIKDIIKGRPYQLKIIKSHFNYKSFDKIILPGQGAYATLMSNLKKLKIIQPLKKYLDNNSSYLGICVGMQILSDWGYEDKTTRGLGIISGDIKKFRNKKLIIPHPRAHLRDFVLRPIADIDSNFIHPTKKISIRNLISQLDENFTFRKLSNRNLR